MANYCRAVTKSLRGTTVISRIWIQISISIRVISRIWIRIRIHIRIRINVMQIHNTLQHRWGVRRRGARRRTRRTCAIASSRGRQSSPSPRRRYRRSSQKRKCSGETTLQRTPQTWRRLGSSSHIFKAYVEVLKPKSTGILNNYQTMRTRVMTYSSNFFVLYPKLFLTLRICGSVWRGEV